MNSIYAGLGNIVKFINSINFQIFTKSYNYPRASKFLQIYSDQGVSLFFKRYFTRRTDFVIVFDIMQFYGQNLCQNSI